MRALATYPALRSVNLPAGAVIVGVHPRKGAPAPSLFVEFNPSTDQTVERQFIIARPGASLAPNASFVASWRDDEGALTALYELTRSDVPDDLPAEMHEHYRTLLREGYTHRSPSNGAPGPFHAWRRPADLPRGAAMSHDAMVAVAELQEHGYGPVVE